MGRSFHSLCLCRVRLWHWQCAHLVPLASSQENLCQAERQVPSFSYLKEGPLQAVGTDP